MGIGVGRLLLEACFCYKFTQLAPRNGRKSSFIIVASVFWGVPVAKNNTGQQRKKD